MPLDDREQRILDEIERQFYEEDPRLAETVRNTTLATVSARNLKWAILALIVGVGIMLGFFTRSTPVALVGFVIMVLAVAWIVGIVQRKAGAGRGLPRVLAGRLRRRRRDDG
jgi:F0F1-type ATP synthase assembly protein I